MDNQTDNSAHSDKELPYQNMFLGKMTPEDRLARFGDDSPGSKLLLIFKISLVLAAGFAPGFYLADTVPKKNYVGRLKVIYNKTYITTAGKKPEVINLKFDSKVLFAKYSDSNSCVKVITTGFGHFVHEIEKVDCPK